MDENVEEPEQEPARFARQGAFLEEPEGRDSVGFLQSLGMSCEKAEATVMEEAAEQSDCGASDTTLVMTPNPPRKRIKSPVNMDGGDGQTQHPAENDEPVEKAEGEGGMVQENCKCENGGSETGTAENGESGSGVGVAEKSESENGMAENEESEYSMGENGKNVAEETDTMGENGKNVAEETVDAKSRKASAEMPNKRMPPAKERKKNDVVFQSPAMLRKHRESRKRKQERGKNAPKRKEKPGKKAPKPKQERGKNAPKRKEKPGKKAPESKKASPKRKALVR